MLNVALALPLPQPDMKHQTFIQLAFPRHVPRQATFRRHITLRQLCFLFISLPQASNVQTPHHTEAALLGSCRGTGDGVNNEF
eukprot:1141964-Pelagomonas_calceolata.AAC.5